MVFFFNYRDRGVVLILIFCAALIPTSMIADLNPPMDLGFFFALNLLFARSLPIHSPVTASGIRPGRFTIPKRKKLPRCSGAMNFSAFP